MIRNRIQILLEVDTDPIPGWGYDPNDFVKHTQRVLDDTISHYNPVVMLVPDIITINMPTDDRVLPARETAKSGP